MAITKKISALVMAAAMAATLAASTAISVSAADVTDTNVYTVESIKASDVTTTGKTIVWNSSSDGTSILEYFVGKYSDPTSQSMAADGIKSSTLTKSGSTYTLTLNTQSITETFLGTPYTADIKTVTAVFQDGSTVLATKNGDVFTITFDSSKQLPWVGTEYANGYQNSIELNLTTTLEDNAIFSLLPDSMKNPQTYFLFTTSF